MSALAQSLANVETERNAGRVEQARRIAFDSLNLPHDGPEDIFRIAQTLLTLNDSAAAEKAFARATVAFPDSADAYHNLGSYYAISGRHSEAEAAYLHALEINPHDADTRRNLGHLYVAFKRLEEADAQFRDAHEFMPGDAKIGIAWAGVLRRLAKFEDAADILVSVIAQEPRNMRARTLLGSILIKLGRFADHAALLETVDEAEYRVEPSDVKLVLDIFMNGALDATHESSVFSALFAGYNDQVAAAPHPISVKPKLTVGYITGYLDKPNYMGFLSALMANHDRQKFDVTVYSETTADNAARSIVGIGKMDNDALGRRIAADGIDILIDLNGFSAIGRMALLARKPAPVIVSWFNTFSTLGLQAIDYLVADEIVAPPEEDGLYAEPIYRLPGCYLLWHASAAHPPVAASPFSQNGQITFGTLASDHKITRHTVDVWSVILDRVPDSRLVLRNTYTDRHYAAYYRETFAACGIDPDRIVVLPGTNHFEFLHTYDAIDIALDTFPWNGGTTTFEALWQGVPVVTYRGDRWAARAATSILTAIGRPEWSGDCLDDYIEIAVSLAQTPDHLEDLRMQQRARIAASELYDAPGFTKKFEAALIDMYRNAGGTV